MKRVYIIVEGQTEEEFIKTTLRDYLSRHNIHDVRPIKIGTSSGHKGGELKYARYKKNIEILLKSQSDIVVTSLIDFFRLRTDFPKYDDASKMVDKTARITYLENAIKEEISNRFFIPYIQLHEFEGLLFTDIHGFDYLMDLPKKEKSEIIQIISSYSNPEMINDGADTAPSKRIVKLIPGYSKTLHGPIIAQENGIQKILDKCPRFNNWVKSIIEKAA